MENIKLMEQVLTGVIDEKLRHDLLMHLFRSHGPRTTAIPILRTCPTVLNNAEIYNRMKSVAGGTSVSVARLLDISPQAYNNQWRRKNISAKSIIEFHLRTGVSLDWLLGSWDGNADYQFKTASPVEKQRDPQKYLSLVEIYDQHTGNTELKWCLTKHQTCVDDNNEPISGDFGALLSLIIRYRDESGTPDKVKNGKKRHFQVRKVLAYVLSDQKTARRLDDRAKKLTLDHASELFERSGKTEFRQYSSKSECLKVFRELAEQNRLRVVEPRYNTIAWDFLIGAGCMTPRDWVIQLMNDIKKCDR